MKVDRPVIFFDGICHFCDSSINLLLDYRSLEKDFFIASLQGQTAKTLLPLHYLEATSSIILYDSNGEILIRSRAVLEILKFIKKPWIYAFFFFKFVPVRYLDMAYNFIAANRYRWWGKRAQCRIPSESERYIFLP